MNFFCWNGVVAYLKIELEMCVQNTFRNRQMSLSHRNNCRFNHKISNSIRRISYIHISSRINHNPFDDQGNCVCFELCSCETEEGGWARGGGRPAVLSPPRALLVIGFFVVIITTLSLVLWLWWMMSLLVSSRPVSVRTPFPLSSNDNRLWFDETCTKRKITVIQLRTIECKKWRKKNKKKWWREDLRQVISLLSYLSRSILQALDGKQLARALNGDESSFIIVLPGFLLHPHPHPPSSPNKTRPFIFHLSEGFEWQLNCIYEKSCGDPPETN